MSANDLPTYEQFVNPAMGCYIIRLHVRLPVAGEQVEGSVRLPFSLRVEARGIQFPMIKRIYY